MQNETTCPAAGEVAATVVDQLHAAALEYGRAVHAFDSRPRPDGVEVRLINAYTKIVLACLAYAAACDREPPQQSNTIGSQEVPDAN